MSPKIVAWMIPAFIAAGCAGPTPYEHITWARVRPQGPDTLRLTARYPNFHRRDGVEEDVVTAAARATAARGFTWFGLDQGETRAIAAGRLPPTPPSRPQIVLVRNPGGAGSTGGRYWRETDYTVHMFRGEKPAQTPGYVALDILKNGIDLSRTKRRGALTS